MNLDKNTNNHTFFGSNPRYWIGKVVEVDKNPSQKILMSGGSWGYRYRVRLLADYSKRDTVPDDDVFVAQALVPLTAGTGGAGRSETVKLSQNDMVLGIFLGADDTAPVILHAFIKSEKANIDKIGTGYTKKVQPNTLLKTQETSQTNTPITPIVEEKANKGNGKGKGAPVDQLGKLKGGTDEENAVGAFGGLSGDSDNLEREEKLKELKNKGGSVNLSGSTAEQVERGSVNLSGMTAEQVRQSTAQYQGVDLFP